MLSCYVSLKAAVRWDHNPEWLLLKCDSEITIRLVSRQSAREMVKPLDSKKVVIQLNTGEGKSSVTVPIVSTTGVPA